MYEVLLAIDGSEGRALSQARAVASLPNASESLTATLCHVFGENPSGASINQVGAVRRAREFLAGRGLEVELVETSGDPAAEIVAVADERDVDLLCLAGRKRTPAGKVLFGSVTQAVLLGTDRPVLVCDPDGGRDE